MSYFQFKQFRIDQEHCAMKVSTDACIQGAWTPVAGEVQKVLDIGAGTGLLALMTAQRIPQARIDAIELDPAAAAQAKANVQASPWADRIRILEGDARDQAFTGQYDFIITNPPFFVNSLLSDRHNRNMARHQNSLGFAALFRIIREHLSEGGYASILLPVAEYELWQRVVEANGWKIFHRLTIVPRLHQKPNRIVSLCSPDLSRSLQEEDLVIRASADTYTPEFTELLRPFYLKL